MNQSTTKRLRKLLGFVGPSRAWRNAKKNYKKLPWNQRNKFFQDVERLKLINEKTANS